MTPSPMRLSIEHTTDYGYRQPLRFGLQESRLTPKSRAGQIVLRWNILVEGGRIEAKFEDQHNNQVALISLDEGVERVRILCDGEVETTDNAGVVGRHGGFAPVWYFGRSTALTQPGPRLHRLARGLADTYATDIDRLHALSRQIILEAPYSIGATDAAGSGEEALSRGAGVCQDHAHIFIAVARLLGYPARYVSGYLALDATVEQDAMHAWAEAHVKGLGWVGFDVSNGISPDDRYVRVATGLDYREAAPVSGISYGADTETLSVCIRVAQ